MATTTIRPRIWLLGALALALSALMGTTLLAGSGTAPAAAPHPAAVTLEPAGHFGGWLAAIAVPSAGGNYIYLGEGSGFTVYDVSDKSRPRQVAGLPLTGTDVSGIALVGSTAYLAHGTGLRVVSLADPRRPILLGGRDLAGAVGIVVAGSTAYVAGGAAGLLIVDVSNPVSPTLRGTYNTPDFARAVQVVGSTAYVADGTSGLQIINVSNPATPTLLGAYDTPGSALDVQVVGSTAYVADWFTGLQILDVSNPISPTRLGFYDTPGYAWDVEVVGTIAYVADHNSGLQILNVSNPVSPTLLATSDGGWWADVVRVSDNYAYVGSGEQGLRVLNVSNPASPVVLGSYERPSALFSLAMAPNPPAPFPVREGGAEGDRFAYAVGQYDFWTLDLTEPAIPRPLGKTALRDGIYARVAASGTLAYVAEQHYGVEIIGVSDPLSPTVIGRYAAAGGAYVHDISIHGHYAYVTMASGGSAPGSDGWLRIVDVSNPLSPTLAASFDTAGDARRILIAPHAATGKTIAYVADGAAGLRLVDVSNPLSPTLLSSVPPPTTTATSDVVYVTGTQAFVGNNLAAGWRLQKLDVTNPLSPTMLAETRADTGRITDLTGHGDLLYVGGSFYVISQSDLAHLLSTPGVQVVNIEVRQEGNHIYIYYTLSSWGSDIVTVSVEQPELTRTPTTAPSRTPTTAPTRTPTSRPSPTATSTTIPPVQAWVDENGVLHVVLQGDADAKITVKDGNVLVNGQPVGDPPAKAADIRGIEVQGGAGSNDIDLSEVKQADFTSLVFVEVNAGDGDDYVVGSEFDDHIDGGAGNDTLSGASGNDTIRGGAGDDLIAGGDGSDNLMGDEGSDTLNGGDGNDLLTGGDGNDFLYGETGDDAISGGEGDDSLEGGEGNDALRGGEGADTIDGGVGNDFLDGEEGDDTLQGGAGADLIFGGAGDDTIYGGAGNDDIDGGDGTDGIGGGDGDDTINGGAGPDGIFGEDGDDKINGGDGNDVIDGGEGTDVLDGGPGDDDIDGGPGQDSLRGGDGDDTLHDPVGDYNFFDGGAGNDTITGGPGNDTIQGGSGNDTINTGDGVNNVDGGDGDDKIFGGAGNDTLFGGRGNDKIEGGGGNDIIGDIPGSTDVITDIAGDDTLDFSEATAGVTLDLDRTYADQVVDAAGNIVRLEGQFENFIGSAFDDVVSVDPLAVPRRVNGGPHAAGDTLNFDAKGAWVADDGKTITVAGYAPVTYTGFETVIGTRPCPALAPGSSWGLTFTTPGVYLYYDAYAPTHAGTVVVGPTVGVSLRGAGFAPKQSYPSLREIASQTPLAMTTTTVITITDAGFNPPTVTIAISDTVRWTNRGATIHAIAGGAPRQLYLPLTLRRSR